MVARLALNYWYSRLIGGDAALEDGRTYRIHGAEYVASKGILRQRATLSDTQSQVKDTFGYKWDRYRTFKAETLLTFEREWTRQKYLGGSASRLDDLVPDGTLILEAGVGSGVSTVALFGDNLRRAHYLGVDISGAVEVAREQFEKHNLPGEFLQADLTQLPFDGPTFDIILSEGVMHHTDNTERTFRTLCRLLNPGGRFMFYVYAKKGPIREFTDDFIRQAVSRMADEEAWNALMPLTRLGEKLGEMKVEVDVPEAIPFLEIPAGKIDLQRFFYQHIFKAFYHPDWTLEDMNLITFDWYRPTNAFRHTPEEVRAWCESEGLAVESMRVEFSGITTVARKNG